MCSWLSVLSSTANVLDKLPKSVQPRAMVFKLIKEAEKGRHKITRRQQLELVQQGRVFKDGELVSEEPAA